MQSGPFRKYIALPVGLLRPRNAAPDVLDIRGKAEAVALPIHRHPQNEVYLILHIDAITPHFALMNKDLPIRKKLPHTAPAWVPNSELFFITINGNPRGLNQFATQTAGQEILDSVKYHHQHKNWFCRLLLLMPDHLHLLAAFPEDTSMKYFITAWKSYLTKQCNLSWQRDFFDHRIRGWKSLEAKAEYIRQNPVRAGLVENLKTGLGRGIIF